jgi:uncharacterized protein YjiS (DUF1127 family)
MSDLMMTRSQPVRATAGRPNAGHLIPLLRMAVRTWLTRQALPELTARERADIGISASAAIAEAARLPWDANPVPRRHHPGILAMAQRALERARLRHLTARHGSRHPIT